MNVTPLKQCSSREGLHTLSRTWETIIWQWAKLIVNTRWPLNHNNGVTHLRLYRQAHQFSHILVRHVTLASRDDESIPPRNLTPFDMSYTYTYTQGQSGCAVFWKQTPEMTDPCSCLTQVMWSTCLLCKTIVNHTVQSWRTWISAPNS